MRFFLVIGTALAVLSCVDFKSDGLGKEEYSIELHLTGFSDTTLFSLYHLDKEEVIDSAYLSDGRLEFRGYVDQPFTARIHAEDELLVLWVDQVKTEVRGSYSNLLYADITGSPLNAVMTKYRDLQRVLDMERDSLMNIVLKQMDAEDAEVIVENKKLIGRVSEIDDLTTRYRVKSIAQEEPSLYTLKELYFLRNSLSQDSLKLFFDRFPSALQETQCGEVIRLTIENRPLAIGDQFVDIEGVDINGQLKRLSDLKGKYVLLDFWASWCGPCRQENIHLLETYQTFKEQGFEIFGFSVDNNSKSWEKAMSYDSLTWPNVRDSKGEYSRHSALYNVQALPTSFLINREGVIVSKNLRGRSLVNRLIQDLD